jgi:hypothetical protein
MWLAERRRMLLQRTCAKRKHLGDGELEVGRVVGNKTSDRNGNETTGGD